MTDVPARLSACATGARRRGVERRPVVFDPARIGSGPAVARHDLPGGARPPLRRGGGVEHVSWRPIVVDAAAHRRLAGTVLRSGRDTETVTVPAAASPDRHDHPLRAKNTSSRRPARGRWSRSHRGHRGAERGHPCRGGDVHVDADAALPQRSAHDPLPRDEHLGLAPPQHGRAGGSTLREQRSLALLVEARGHREQAPVERGKRAEARLGQRAPLPEAAPGGARARRRAPRPSWGSSGRTSGRTPRPRRRLHRPSCRRSRRVRRGEVRHPRAPAGCPACGARAGGQSAAMAMRCSVAGSRRADGRPLVMTTRSMVPVNGNGGR